MDLIETRQKIATDDDFVLEELKKLRTLYGLKQVIRYGRERIHEADTESVAEHIYAIHILIDYFLPLEDTEGTWDALKVHQMAQYHDIDEIITGDIPGYLKTEEQYNNEQTAAIQVIDTLPDSLKGPVQVLMDEFDSQTTVEARFVKAIDKLESVFQMYSEMGKEFLHQIEYNKKLHQDYKSDYINEFPLMKRFETVMEDVYEKEGFYFNAS